MCTIIGEGRGSFGVCGRQLNHNSLSGNVPLALCQLQHLNVLTLHQNKLVGTLPQCLSPQLHILTVHENALSGVLPSFINFTKLDSLTLFRNQFKGRLTLPHVAPRLSNLLVHNNRLSCDLVYNRTPSAYNLASNGSPCREKYTCQVALVASGNRFSNGAIPMWAAMASVHFLWIRSLWEGAMALVLGYALGGTTLLTIGVVATLRGNWLRFFVFTLDGPYQHLQWLWVKLLVLLSTAGLVILLPLFVAGANEYQCGQQWLRTTLAYLADNGVVEWAAATMLCIYTMASTTAVVVVWSFVNKNYATNSKPAAPPVKWWQYGVLYPSWFVATLIFSMPSLVYAATKSIPGNTPGSEQNILNLSTEVLAGFHICIGPVINFVNSAIVPTTARNLVQKVCGNDMHTGLVTGMREFATFMVTLGVPCSAFCLLGTDCYGGWLELWKAANPFPLTVDSNPSLVMEGVCR